MVFDEFAMAENECTRRYQIGVLAALSGVTPRALRLYEARGLLGEPERAEAGYRLYGTAELVRAIRIRRLRALRMGLDQLAQIIEDDAGATALSDQLALLRDDLRRRAALLSRAAADVTLLLAETDEAVCAELLAAAEQSAELDSAELQQRAAQSEGSAALASLLAERGWSKRWQPVAVRLRQLRDAEPNDPQVVEVARAAAKLLPASVLPDEAAPPTRLELFPGRRFSAAQVCCLHLARTMVNQAEAEASK
jgi:DNA-binding transcriptional MerR regulator